MLINVFNQEILLNKVWELLTYLVQNGLGAWPGYHLSLLLWQSRWCTGGGRPPPWSRLRVGWGGPGPLSPLGSHLGQGLQEEGLTWATAGLSQLHLYRGLALGTGMLNEQKKECKRSIQNFSFFLSFLSNHAAWGGNAVNEQKYSLGTTNTWYFTSNGWL